MAKVSDIERWDRSEFIGRERLAWANGPYADNYTVNPETSRDAIIRLEKSIDAKDAQLRVMKRNCESRKNLLADLLVQIESFEELHQKTPLDNESMSVILGIIKLSIKELCDNGE